MRVIFVTADTGGNVPPTVAIAEELVRRGHEVAIAGLRPRADAPDHLTRLDLPALAGMDVRRRAGVLGHAPALARMAVGRAVARQVREFLAGRRPDAVVVDGVMLTSLREAARSGIPTAALFHTLGQFWAQGMANPVLNAALSPARLAPLALLERVQARLLPTDRDLDPAGRGGSRIAFDWLGTTERAQPAAERVPGERPLVLVSLSSAWQRGQGDVYRRIIRALGSLPVRAIVTAGGVDLDGELTAPPTIEVRGWAPHAELMPHADLVVGHGGHSTTMKALAHGIPLLILPMDPTSDQPLMGRTVAAAGLGRTLSRGSSPGQIAAAALAILADPVIRAAAAGAGARLRAQDGAAVGAALVERIAHRSAAPGG